MTKKPVCLIILDGWGIREYENGNAVSQAQTPNYDHWLKTYERSILDASGEAVGLTPGQMGNSEVGHLNLGAGRIIYQDLTRISKSIRDGDFFSNETLLSAFSQIKPGGKMHLMGLFSPGGVHSHSDHLLALLKIAKETGVSPVLHLITDGRDTPPQNGEKYLNDFLDVMVEDNLPGKIATVSGRYYTMDRDKRWERTELAFNALAHREGRKADSPQGAIEQAYAQGETDEFIIPTVIDSADDLSIAENDTIFFFNFRSDRMRQIIATFFKDFDAFDRGTMAGVTDLYTITQYDPNYPTTVVYEKQKITNTLAETISQHGGKQFHSAETEKYAHVTYFFNGGVEAPFPGEERFLAPSPKVATYDLQPEMSAPELTEAFIARVESGSDDFMLINFANPDMVGHTGVLAAAKKAVETVDECAGLIVEKVLEKGGVALVTADHGNAETMTDEISGGPHTYHTTNPVSLIMIDKQYHQMQPRGILADVAPTILHLLGLPQPEEMTGNNLVMGTRE